MDVRHADGAALRTVDRGVAFDDGAASPAFAAAGDWSVLARELFAARRVREGLAAVARAAVAVRDRELLVRAVAEHVVPLTPEREAQWGEAIAQSTDATGAGSGCAGVRRRRRGSLPRLASVLPGQGAAAVDFVEASLLLAPERRMTHLTRALLHFQRGDEAAARADAAVVEQESAEAAESLRAYAKTIFRAFDWWPAREQFGPDPELVDVVVEPAQPMDSLRHMLAVYGTRLARVRAAIRGAAARRRIACVDAARSVGVAARRAGRSAARTNRMRAR